MKRSVVMWAWVVGVAWGCGDATGPSESPTPITELPRELSINEQGLIDASNRFTVDLLRRVHEALPESTVVLSPLSASMALGMTMNGAAGVTRSQMQEMIGFGELSPSDINEAYRGLIELLRDLDPRVDFRLANAIFHRDVYQMEAPFLDVARTYFDARIEGLDFDDPAAAEHINGWVREATANRIDGMVEAPIDPLTVAFLMNAIYFKGDWARRFDGNETYTGAFHRGSGGTQDVRFMTKTDMVWYRASPSWRAVEMP